MAFQANPIEQPQPAAGLFGNALNILSICVAGDPAWRNPGQCGQHLLPVGHSQKVGGGIFKLAETRRTNTPVRSVHLIERHTPP